MARLARGWGPAWAPALPTRMTARSVAAAGAAGGLPPAARPPAPPRTEAARSAAPQWAASPPSSGCLHQSQESATSCSSCCENSITQVPALGPVKAAAGMHTERLSGVVNCHQYTVHRLGRFCAQHDRQRSGSAEQTGVATLPGAAHRRHVGSGPGHVLRQRSFADVSGQLGQDMDLAAAHGQHVIPLQQTQEELNSGLLYPPQLQLRRGSPQALAQCWLEH